MRLNGLFSAIGGVLLLLFAAEQYGVGAFCFEDEFLTWAFSGPAISSPDCFLVNSGFHHNLKALVVVQISVALVLAIGAFAAALGFLTRRSRSAKLATAAGLLSAFFSGVLLASSAFGHEAIIGLGASLCFVMLIAIRSRLSP